MCVDKKRRYHVINNLKLENTELPKMKLPHIQDQALEGRKPDVLVIGGGISGASIARELMKWKLDVLLAEKKVMLPCMLPVAMTEKFIRGSILEKEL